MGGLFICALLVTGCTANTVESKPEYDELDLMSYRICLEKVVDGWVKSGSFILTSQYIEQAKSECAKLIPVKK